MPVVPDVPAPKKAKSKAKAATKKAKAATKKAESAPKKAKAAPKKKPAKTAPADDAPAEGARRFVYGDETSGKFWEVSQSGDTHTVRYGKCGSNGQTREKSFPDEAAAKKDVDRLVRQKTGKGYVEVG